MTVETDDDNNNISRLEELLFKLLIDMCVADEAVEEDERKAVVYAVGATLDFVRLLAGHFHLPGPLPGVALAGLGMAIQDLDDGIVGPLLSPAEQPRRGSAPDKTNTTRGKRPRRPTKVQMLRAEVAASMELLMRAGREREEAAKEVVKKLNRSPILTGIKGEYWITVARWRTNITEGGASPTAATHYHSFLTEATNLVRANGGNSADLVRIVNHTLQCLGKP